MRHNFPGAPDYEILVLIDDRYQQSIHFRSIDSYRKKSSGELSTSGAFPLPGSCYISNRSNLQSAVISAISSQAMCYHIRLHNIHSPPAMWLNPDCTYPWERVPFELHYIKAMWKFNLSFICDAWSLNESISQTPASILNLIGQFRTNW